MPSRPCRRTLVRWNDDHDKELLLWIVYCCGEQGMKLPFARIAQCMGPTYTEGACIQHLAKIRTKMEEAGLHVPPAQKRGTVTRQGSSIYRSKPKDTNAPVPRVRPDIPPPPRAGGFYDEDEEFESDEHMESDNTPNPVVKKAPRRQARPRKGSVTIKPEPEEDDNSSALLEGAYSRKQPKPSAIKRPASQITQMTLNFNEQLDTMTGDHTPGYADFNTLPSVQRSPSLKLESIENRKRETIPPLIATQIQQGTRRRNSAFDPDNGDDDDYEPETGVRGRKRQQKGGRAAKKQKTDNKGKHDSRKDESEAAMIGYQEASTYDADRAAMPPPSRPSANPNGSFGWNSHFMNQPFVRHSKHQTDASGLNMSTDAWEGISPTTGQTDDFNMGYGDYGGDPNFRTHFAYGDSGMPPTMSAADSRNHSFASAKSNSTIESQPASWNQPVRSKDFPNPQEASRVLQQALNTPNADAFTQIDIFDSPVQDYNSLYQWNGNLTDQSFGYGAGNEMSSTTGDSDRLFVGMPETEENDMLYSHFLNEAGFDGR